MANENMEKRIASDFDKAFDALQEIDKQTRTKMPEAIFKTIFLPLFANMDNIPVDGTIHNWVALAGSQFSSVDIVDPQNNVLFTVPPVFSPEAIRPQEMQRTEPISAIVATADMLAKRSPIESNNYIANKFYAAGRQLQGKVDKLDYVRSWNQIFEYYGLPKLVELPTEQAVIPENPKYVDIRDELRGDDLEFTPI